MVSTAGSFDEPASAVGVPELSPCEDLSSRAFDALLSKVGVGCWVFFSFKRASSPSTLFSSASRTSVFGPLFFGTASAERNESGQASHTAPRAQDEAAMIVLRVRIMKRKTNEVLARHTIHTSTLENLACLARRS